MKNARSESGRQAPVERLWERSREERKETNSEAKYRNLEGKHEKSGWRERGDRGSESGDGHRESNCEAEPGREGKEEQRLSSQNPKLKRPKGSENSGGQKEKRKRQQAVKVEAQRKPEAKAEGKGEPERSSCRD